MNTRFVDLLNERPYLLADGATGTNYFNMGLVSGDAPELWNIDHPDRVASLHRSFLDAGSDIILTNTFGGSRYRLKLHNAQDRVHELNVAAAHISRQEADKEERPVIVAGSMGPTGELFEPVGELTFEEGKSAFAEQAAALAEGGVDVLWLETLSSIEELEAAVAGAATVELPMVSTLSFDTNGSTMMGITPVTLANICSQLTPAPVAYGTNCGVGPSEVAAAIIQIHADRAESILIAKANCGIPEFKDGAIRYSGTPELMADYACIVRDAGARIIGGCCGTTSEHVRRMREALDTTPS
ncbi:MAG: betaine--homocysteine S-methyltransferase, partial [Gammaproteobacteria bacterium]|nr:betaine--homocysteine S-methyltransferase [Gammaproteobacteria bacterium]